MQGTYTHPWYTGPLPAGPAGRTLLLVPSPGPAGRTLLLVSSSSQDQQEGLFSPSPLPPRTSRKDSSPRLLFPGPAGGTLGLVIASQDQQEGTLGLVIASPNSLYRSLEASFSLSEQSLEEPRGPL